MHLLPVPWNFSLLAVTTSFNECSFVGGFDVILFHGRGL